MMSFTLSHGMHFGSTAQPSVNFLRIFMTDGCVLQFCREGMGILFAAEDKSDYSITMFVNVAVEVNPPVSLT